MRHFLLGGVLAMAASLPLMSTLGLSTARRIAVAEGADLEGGIVDDCCCAEAALQAAQLQYPSYEHAADDNVVPLVRLAP